MTTTSVPDRPDSACITESPDRSAWNSADVRARVDAWRKLPRLSAARTSHADALAQAVEHDAFGLARLVELFAEGDSADRSIAAAQVDISVRRWRALHWTANDLARLLDAVGRCYDRIPEETAERLLTSYIAAARRASKDRHGWRGTYANRLRLPSRHRGLLRTFVDRCRPAPAVLAAKWVLFGSRAFSPRTAGGRREDACDDGLSRALSLPPPLMSWGDRYRLTRWYLRRRRWPASPGEARLPEAVAVSLVKMRHAFGLAEPDLRRLADSSPVVRRASMKILSRGSLRNVDVLRSPHLRLRLLEQLPPGDIPRAVLRWGVDLPIEHVLKLLRRVDADHTHREDAVYEVLLWNRMTMPRRAVQLACDRRPSETDRPPRLVVLGDVDWIPEFALSFDVLPVHELADLLPWLAVGRVLPDKFVLAYHRAGAPPPVVPLSETLDHHLKDAWRIVAFDLPVELAPALLNCREPEDSNDSAGNAGSHEESAQPASPAPIDTMDDATNDTTGTARG